MESQRNWSIFLVMSLFISCQIFAVDQVLFGKVPQVSVLGISGDVEFEDLVPQQENQSTSIVEDATSHYSISNNAASIGKITARLTNPPQGLTIFATLTPPPGASNSQMIQLTSSDQVMVSGIGRGCFAANLINYHVIADLQAVQALPNFNTLITYTLTSGGAQ